MTPSNRYLSPSEAAARLGISVKALRVWEARGLVAPPRTQAGWRAYGPEEMDRARDIASLRTLGFSLSQIERLLDGDARGLDPVLAAHQSALEDRIGRLSASVTRVRGLREAIAGGHAPAPGAFTCLAQRDDEIEVAFDLPWPWGGERFELRRLRALTFITGPLGCGKTRLARELAETLPDAAFVGLDRAVPALPGTPPDPGFAERVERTLEWIAGDGGTVNDDLAVLIGLIEARAPAVLVIDMVEQGLDHATQEALIARLRRRPGTPARPLILLTRSSAILDPAAVGPDETILYCPANHSPPVEVAPYAGSPGYESLQSCLAPPEVRARTEGVVAIRPAAS